MQKQHIVVLVKTVCIGILAIFFFVNSKGYRPVSVAAPTRKMPCDSVNTLSGTEYVESMPWASKGRLVIPDLHISVALYDVSGGEITLDGENIRHYTLKSLRGSIGMVQQDVYLFSGTVYENIAYGKPGATREEVIAAAKAAGADSFVQDLKDGYDTYIGERGVKLSGGQKQRISIARVFLKNPPIIILDEATSALDNESEYEVAKSLASLSVGRTTITIAHRLSSIVHSDRILVLTEDGIVEEGNHQQLMEQKGLYYELYTRANEVK